MSRRRSETGVVLWRLGVSVPALVLGSTAAPALAAEVAFTGPRSCSRGEELAARVERALGTPLSASDDLRCAVHVVRDAGAYAARLELSSRRSRAASRQISFSEPTCERLLQTLELALVLAVGAEGAQGRAALPEAPPARSLQARDEPGVEGASGAWDEPDARSRAVSDGADREAAASAASVGAPAAGPRWTAMGTLVADGGAVSRLAPGAQLGAALALGSFELRSAAAYFWPRPTRAEALEGSGAEASLAFATGALLACAPSLVQTAELEIGACAGPELWQLWVERAEAPTIAAESWLAARAELVARWAIGLPGLSIHASAGAASPLLELEARAAPESRPRRGASAPGARLGLGLTLALAGQR